MPWKTQNYSVKPNYFPDKPPYLYVKLINCQGFAPRKIIVVDLKYFIGTSFFSVQKLTSKLAHNKTANYILIVCFCNRTAAKKVNQLTEGECYRTNPFPELSLMTLSIKVKTEQKWHGMLMLIWHIRRKKSIYFWESQGMQRQPQATITHLSMPLS